MAWEVVSSIEGNGKTYNLSQIKSSALNGGSSVTGADASSFDVLTDESSISALILDVIPSIPENVVVHYTIPVGTYSYIKLVYKKDSIPTTYSDGTSIDITQASTEQEIEGICDGNTYYFVIFTDKSTSEPKWINTSEAFRTVHLEDVLKTTDLTHVQNQSTASFGNPIHFSEYYNLFSGMLNSDYILHGYSNSSTVGMVYNQAERKYTLDYTNGSTGYAMPLNDIHKIKKIKFSYRVVNRRSGWAVSLLEFYQKNSYSQNVFAALYKALPTNVTAQGINVSDTDWHDAEFDVDLTNVEYINLACVDIVFEFKNIDLIII